jgi:hypothetical protein
VQFGILIRQMFVYGYEMVKGAQTITRSFSLPKFVFFEYIILCKYLETPQFWFLNFSVGNIHWLNSDHLYAAVTQFTRNLPEIYPRMSHKPYTVLPCIFVGPSLNSHLNIYKAKRNSKNHVHNTTSAQKQNRYIICSYNVTMYCIWMSQCEMCLRIT